VGGTSLLPEIVRRLDKEEIIIAELALKSPTLYDVFLVITGHTAEENTGVSPCDMSLVLWNNISTLNNLDQLRLFCDVLDDERFSFTLCSLFKT
jgi:hypothetical protein